MGAFLFIAPNNCSHIFDVSVIGFVHFINPDLCVNFEEVIFAGFCQFILYLFGHIEAAVPRAPTARSFTVGTLHDCRLPTRSSILLARIPVTRIEERASMPARLATLARLFQQLKQSNPRPILSTAHYTTELETPSSINRRVLLPRSSAVEARHASLDPRLGRGLEALKSFPH